MKCLFQQGFVVCVASLVLSTAPPALKANGPAPSRKTAQFEISFMQGMIDHHAMAVMMSSLCLDRAIHEELLALCDQIANTQTQEIQQMQTWLAEWYGIDYEPRMSRGMQNDLQKLAELDGAEFEVAFMLMMIRHHATAIREGERCAENAYHRPLIQLCENIVRTQTAEIQTMSQWLFDWYGDCDQP